MLLRRAQRAISQSHHLHVVVMDTSVLDSDGEESSSLRDMLSKCFDNVQAMVEQAKAQDPLQVVRIFAPTLCLMHASLGLLSEESTRLLALTALRLKLLAQETESLFSLSCIPSSIPHGVLSQLKAIADTHLRVESFAGASDSVPYEFKAFSGLLAVMRVQAIGVMAPFRPQNQRYGLRRDRRKLHVEPLHLPPEESRAVGAASTGDSRSTCSTAVAGGKSISVDF